MGLEHANSYMEGLSTTPFPDPYSGAYKWLQAVEAQASTGARLGGGGCGGLPARPPARPQRGRPRAPGGWPGWRAYV